ncbi:YitT family protein [Candidatus Allofournierella excrementigallinarum]|uniref:YitT family protein n=1 Tax=Candidatus Allofournierella excrementigallinarum TaxID=2838592 RepID=UPI00374E5163
MKGFILPARGKNILLVLLGNALYALAVDMFVLPCGLITGGTTGLALAARYWFDVPVAGFVLASNIVMFAVGALAMGRWFAFNTALSTFCYPLFLDLFVRIPGIDGFTRDPMLGTVFAGVLIGVAIGLVIGAGASSGGMDIPPIVLNKYFGLPVGAVMYLLDFLILIGQMVFAGKEQILYGILLVLLYTVILEKVSVMGHAKIQVKILSEKNDEIRRIILRVLDRGCTVLHAQTGYTRTERDMLLTVVTNRELAKLNHLVLETDPQAFIVISSVNEVHGRGFTLQKIYK